jgi:Integrase zinc binding domain/Chromo (CHRromatin Organisation MOdifier) domain
MKEWEDTFPIERVDNLNKPFWRDIKGQRLVIPPDQGLRCEIMNSWHEGPLNGHPGRDETIRRVNKHYFWPGARAWITEYIKGCAVCQQNKNLTHRIKTPLYRIPSTIDAKPFSHVAMDLITGLPKSDGHDAILTIVDHGCSRGAIFLPCSSTITGAGIAKLYLEHVFRWFGLPQKIISDRDPRFTSHFGKSLTKALGINQNLSTAFHPQTDGLSERKNQWVEQYLCLICSNQDQWSRWLPLATAVHNNAQNSTTGIAPSKLLIGWEPPLTPNQIIPTSNQKTEEYVSKFQKYRLMAISALNKVATPHTPLEHNYRLGQRVWLEAKNLPLSHGTIKLSPKHYGPFVITKLISPVASQLSLPASWNIHPVFHNTLLTPFVETSAHGPNFTRPPPELIDGEVQYEVEAIRSHRYFGKNKRLQYLLKWKGYPEADNTWESEDQLNTPDLLKSYNRRHGLENIKASARVVETHSPSPASLWSSTIPTHISTTPSIQPSLFSTTRSPCPLSTLPMNLPPRLHHPRPIYQSHSTPSQLTSPPSPQTTHQYRRKLRSTSSPLSPTSTKRFAPSRTGLSPPSTDARWLTRLRPRSAMKPTVFSRSASSSMQRSSTANSSFPGVPTDTSLTRGASQLKSPSERDISPMPSSSSSETTEGPCYLQERTIGKNRTPSSCISIPTTHQPAPPSHSRVGSTHYSTGQHPPSTPFAAPLPISTTGTRPLRSSATDASTTASATSVMNSPSSKPRFISSRTTSPPAVTASRQVASLPKFQIWRAGRGPKTTPHADAPWEEVSVEGQEAQTRAGGDDIVVYPRSHVVSISYAKRA